MLRLAAQLEKLDTRMDNLELSTSQALSVKADRAEVVAVAEKLESKADRTEVVAVTEKLESKVGYQHFYWIMGVLLTILCGIFAWMVPKIEKTSDGMSFLTGKFQNITHIEQVE